MPLKRKGMEAEKDARIKSAHDELEQRKSVESIEFIYGQTPLAKGKTVRRIEAHTGLRCVETTPFPFAAKGGVSKGEVPCAHGPVGTKSREEEEVPP